MAQTLAVAEGLARDQQNLVRLSALMHDVDDYKYSGDEGATEATVTVRQNGQRLAEDPASASTYVYQRQVFVSLKM